jgi:hypothetical protein
LCSQLFLIPQRYERDAIVLARKVVTHWKRYVRRKKEGHPMAVPLSEPALVSVVEGAIEELEANETTSLLV